jgi:glucan phosphoethanolaminetransferase (alkaline phosphatase superfamily)
VVFVIEESLGRARMSLYGHQRRTTPELERWAREEPEALAVFSRAYTNSGNTSVVLPELLTGLPPSASLDALHSAPFLWQLAAAAGYRTLLLSAQSFRYASFSDYFLSTPPERVFTADKAGAELVNGGGMDDRVFARHVQKELAAALLDARPFFAVVQYNATHHPILRLPPAAPEFAGDTAELRYDNAVVLLDRLLAALVRQLREAGALERTLLVITSDHGESLGQRGRHRTQSYYDEVLAIPIIIHAPALLRSQRPDAVEALRKNRDLNVQNLDLPKTVLDALGLLERPELATFVAAMGGQSLFSELSPDRVLYALNNTAARHWTNEGFAFVQRDKKYMFSERGGHEYYDLLRDPGEKRNLWPELRTPPPWVANALGAQPAYAKLLAEHARAGDPLRVSLEKVSLR